MAHHNLPAQSLYPLPMNPTLFGYFEDSEVRFENTAEDFGRILGEVMMGEYGVPLSLTDDGVRMLIMPTGVVIEEDTVRLTYQYAESGGVSVLAVSLTGDACTCEVVHLTGGEGAAIVVLSGSPSEVSSYTEDIIALISAAVEKNARLVLEWGSEQVVADYVNKSSNPVLSFRRDLVSYEVTLDTASNTATVESVSALTQSNVKDSVGEGTTDVMSQKAVSEALEMMTEDISAAVSVVNFAADPTVASSWDESVASRVRSLMWGIALLRTADDRYPVVSFEKADGTVYLRFLAGDMFYDAVVPAEGAVTLSSTPAAGSVYVDMDASPASSSAWVPAVCAAVYGAADAGRSVVLRNEGVTVILSSMTLSGGILTASMTVDGMLYTVTIPESKDSASLAAAVPMPVTVVTVEGDLEAAASYNDAADTLREAARRGDAVVIVNSDARYFALASAAEGDNFVSVAFSTQAGKTVTVTVPATGTPSVAVEEMIPSTALVQETGAATDKIMSQDAVTKKLINTLTLTGDVTGTGTPADGSLSVATTIHGAAKTVTLTGAVTGSGTAADGVHSGDTTLSGGAN